MRASGYLSVSFEGWTHIPTEALRSELDARYGLRSTGDSVTVEKQGASLNEVAAFSLFGVHRRRASEHVRHLQV